MLRQLYDRIQFEPDESKTRTLAQIVAVSGTKELSNDEHKLSVLGLFSRLSHVQMKLLKIISDIKASQRSSSGTGITFGVTAIFSDNIAAALKNNPEGRFWEGNLDLAVELDMLESTNFLRRLTWTGDAVPSVLTRFERKAVDYLKRTDPIEKSFDGPSSIRPGFHFRCTPCATLLQPIDMAGYRFRLPPAGHPAGNLSSPCQSLYDITELSPSAGGGFANG